ncbi:MAG: DNA primase [Kordiimonadaceae bacterium]|nr:DNA primase [Kordiimonadaceae bacterium]
MKYSEAFLEEIKGSIQISAFIGGELNQPQFSPSTKVCCPFHNEKSPSFSADDIKQFYHCFGCAENGNIFTFIQKYNKVSFPEAVAIAASYAGIPLPAKRAETGAEKKRARLLAVMEMVTGYFQTELQKTNGSKALAYLSARKVTDASIGNFKLGYSPAGTKTLLKAMISQGITKEELAEIGMISLNGDGSFNYSLFRDRVMFPISNTSGAVIGFGARALDPTAKAKYLNSPDSTLFKKGKGLFNYDGARKNRTANCTPVVVEGYTDVITAVQAGYGCAVAPLGTALTLDQLKLLWQLHPEPILCFDGDAAGQKAARRALLKLLPEVAAGKSFKFLSLPEGEDPDSLIREKGAAAFGALLTGAASCVDYLWSSTLSCVPTNTPEQKAGFQKEVLSIAGTINDTAVRTLYSSALSSKAAAAFGLTKDHLDFDTILNAAAAEKQILGILFSNPSKSDLQHFIKTSWETSGAGAMVQTMHSLYSHADTVSSRDFFLSLADVGLAGLLADISLDRKLFDATKLSASQVTNLLLQLSTWKRRFDRA